MCHFYTFTQNLYCVVYKHYFPLLHLICIYAPQVCEQQAIIHWCIKTNQLCSSGQLSMKQDLEQALAVSG